MKEILVKNKNPNFVN